jgi:hypothetical protein
LSARKVRNINIELIKVHTWLCANKLSLNIEKSNFVIFHPPQRKITYNVELKLNDKLLKQEKCIKYLGIFIDSNLSWKAHINHICMKIKRSVGILSKLRYYVNTDILCNLYYALIYPLLIYGIVSWGNTYQTTLQPIIVLQKKALRIITFSKFQEPSSPLFRFFSILKLVDLISLHTLIFMYQYHNQLLPSTFDNFFTPVAQIHSYNTRSAARQTYYLPSIRTNYGKFNVRFLGPQLWNSLEDNIKNFSLQRFNSLTTHPKSFNR